MANASLQHSKLFVKFFCWYIDDGYTVYIAMEYHPEGDLNRHITKVGPLSEAVVRGITEQILQGVFVLHALNVYHRDIKPQVCPLCLPLFAPYFSPSDYSHLNQNILVVSTNPIKIKIADFGGAKRIAGSYNTRIGTDGWAAPEIERQNYGELVDMWSVGCVVYYLLTSFLPFDDGFGRENKERIEQFTFHFWPRLPLFKFQEGDVLKRGDQILVKGMSNLVNDFLKRLIVRNTSRRMPASAALNHRWICQTSPLQAALVQDNFPLAALLAKHDPRYNSQWAAEPTPSLAPILLRIAAATGHIDNVKRALQDMPSQYDFKYIIPTWPIKPALVGAATVGSLPIVQLLIGKLQKAERSYPIVLEACKAALEGGHHQVAGVLWGRVSIRDSAWDHQLSQLIARYANSTLLDRAYTHWMTYRSDIHGAEIVEVKFGHPSSAYSHHFPAMLGYAARHGNTERVKWFLKMRPRDQTVCTDVVRQAIRGGHFDTVVLLLEDHPLPSRARDAPNPLLATALVDAASYGHFKIVECLIERGVVPGIEAVREAVRKNNDQIFLYLIETLINRCKVDGRRVANYITPAAVPHCDIAVLEWLCRIRADLTFPGNLVEHVLQAARLGGIERLIWLMRKRGKDVDEPEIMKQALIGASERGHIDIVMLLCERRANAKIPEPWAEAARGGHIAILDHLKATHPTPGKSILRPALAAAVTANCLGTVLWLLCAGASLGVSHRRVRGRTPGGSLRGIAEASHGGSHWVDAQLKCHSAIQGLLDDFSSLE